MLTPLASSRSVAGRMLPLRWAWSSALGRLRQNASMLGAAVRRERLGAAAAAVAPASSLLIEVLKCVPQATVTQRQRRMCCMRSDLDV